MRDLPGRYCPFLPGPGGSLLAGTVSFDCSFVPQPPTARHPPTPTTITPATRPIRRRRNCRLSADVLVHIHFYLRLVARCHVAEQIAGWGRTRRRRGMGDAVGQELDVPVGEEEVRPARME